MKTQVKQHTRNGSAVSAHERYVPSGRFGAYPWWQMENWYAVYVIHEDDPINKDGHWVNSRKITDSATPNWEDAIAWAETFNEMTVDEFIKKFECTREVAEWAPSKKTPKL